MILNRPDMLSPSRAADAQFTENAVQSDPHNRVLIPRFDVYIACANLDRVEDQIIHQHTHFNAAFFGYGLEIAGRLIHG